MILETLPVGLLGCNCSIVGDEASREAMVVDPGDEIPRIVTLLEKHGLAVKLIAVTHAHIDHIAGAAKLKKITGAPILYNQNDLPLVKMMDAQAAWLGMAAPEVAPPDDDLSDQRVLRIGAADEAGEAVGAGAQGNMSPGISGVVLLTPGHTQGSLCLYLPEERLLLAGDTLFAGSVGRTDLPGGDGRQLIRSIREKLLPLPDETAVVPGHGPNTTIGRERVANPFLLRG